MIDSPAAAPDIDYHGHTIVAVSNVNYLYEILDLNWIILTVARTVDEARMKIDSIGEAIANHGLSRREATTRTGFGLRRIGTCCPNDMISVKLAAGALTAEGARRVLEGDRS